MLPKFLKRKKRIVIVILVESYAITVIKKAIMQIFTLS